MLKLLIIVFKLSLDAFLDSKWLQEKKTIRCYKTFAIRIQDVCRKKEKQSKEGSKELNRVRNILKRTGEMER